jgi:uncharacterized phiE125 gp8 family phage protein
MLIVSTPPAAFAVSLAEAKAHLIVEHSDHDAQIEELIETAQQIAEEHCQRRFITQTLQWTPLQFILPLYFPLAPVDITSVVIEYVPDGGSDYTTFAATNYIVRTRSTNAPAFVTLKSGISFPLIETDHAALVRITFACGAASAPKTVQRAIKLILSDLYRHRETVSPTAMAQIPMSATVETLLAAQCWAWR